MLALLNQTNEARPRYTAASVGAYCDIYPLETNSSRKAEYLDYITKGLEFLMTVQDLDAEGGILGSIGNVSTSPNITQIPDVFVTSEAGISFTKCFRTLGNTDYLSAADDIANWSTIHQAYPYNTSPTYPYKYYSNANHLARQSLFFSYYYEITGDQEVLDASIEIAEEIMAWQDFRDTNDPWVDPNIGPDYWDGGWYWYIYNPHTPPIGSSPDSCQQGYGCSNDFNRYMRYHETNLWALTKLLDVTGQHLLPGTTTGRNSDSYPDLRIKLINGIKKGVNYMMDNQETSDLGNKVAGLIKEFKDYKEYSGTTLISSNRTIPSHNGLLSTLDAYYNLYRYTEGLSGLNESHRLWVFHSTISDAMNGERTGNSNWGWPGWEVAMLNNWARLAQFRNETSISNWDNGLKLTNPSFEQDIIEWELWSWNNTGVSISDSFSRTGNKSVHIKDQSSSASMWAAQIIEVQPNTSYTAEAYAKVISGYQSLYIKYYDEDYNLLNFDATSRWSSSSFQKVTRTLTSPFNAKYAVISLQTVWAYSSEAYWDDISFFETGTPKIVPVGDETSSSKIMKFSLSQNYPNPFNPTTIIRYSVGTESPVQLHVFDITGRMVKSLVNKTQKAGSYEVNFDASDLPTGIYFYTLSTPNFSETKQLTLIK
jgi:hypothetical protein